MNVKYKELLIYLLSILVLILFLYFSINYLIKRQIEIINFIDSDIHEDFEIEITSNLNDINNYLKEYLFIENYLLKRKKNEIIFFDNTTAPLNYFKSDYLDTIKLIDKSKNSIYINQYLSDSYQTLSTLFKINQIEYIDDRRYNLVLSNGRIVMLPKVIDSKLLYFIKNNIDLIDKSTNYKELLDLRNFHNKTIRLK